jgi:hypothetical protein
MCPAHRIPADLLARQIDEHSVTYSDIFNNTMQTNTSQKKDSLGKKRVQETLLSTTEGAAALADAHTLAGILTIL